MGNLFHIFFDSCSTSYIKYQCSGILKINIKGTIHNTLFFTSSQKICTKTGVDQKRISEIRNHRSSRSEVFCNKGALRNFVAKFTGKHLCQSLFFYKVAGLQVFSYEFCEISKNTFSYTAPTVAASEIKLLSSVYF